MQNCAIRKLNPIDQLRLLHLLNTSHHSVKVKASLLLVPVRICVLRTGWRSDAVWDFKAYRYRSIIDIIQPPMDPKTWRPQIGWMLFKRIKYGHEKRWVELVVLYWPTSISSWSITACTSSWTAVIGLSHLWSTLLSHHVCALMGVRGREREREREKKKKNTCQSFKRP